MDDEENLRQLDAILVNLDEAMAATSWREPTDEYPLTLRGDRGMFRMDRFRISLDPADLRGALDDLDAVTRAEHHPDWPMWCYWFGAAHMADLFTVAADDDTVHAVAWLERAVVWLERAMAGEHPELNRSGIANELAELYCDLYGELSDPGIASVDELLATLHRLRVPAADGEHFDLWRAFIGSAYEERFRLSDDRGDLDVAIALLAPAIGGLPADVALRSSAYRCLSRAYFCRHELDQDATTLDRLVELTGQATAELSADDPVRAEMYWRHAFALETRFKRTADHFDRDRQIETLTSFLALVGGDELDPDDAEGLADALASRGKDYSDPHDLLAAAGWYGTALEHTTPDAKFRSLLLMDEANAYRIHHELTGSVDHLPRCLAALDEALALSIPDVDVELVAHMNRLQTDNTLREHLASTGRDAAEESAATMRYRARPAADAVLRHIDAHVEIRAMTAFIAAATLAQANAADEQLTDLSLIRDLVAIAETHPTVDPTYRQTVAGLSAPVELMGLLRDTSRRKDFGLPRIARAVVDRPETVVSAEVRRLAGINRYFRAHWVGDIKELGAAAKAMPPSQDGEDSATTLLRAMSTLSELNARGDVHAFGAVAAEALAAIRAEGDSSIGGRLAESVFGNVAALMAIGSGQLTDPLPDLPETDGSHPFDHLVRAARATVLGINAVVFTQRADARAADTAVADLVRVVDSVSPDAQSLPLYIPLYAQATVSVRLVLMVARPYDRELLDRGLAWGETALRGQEVGDHARTILAVVVAVMYRSRRAPGDLAIARAHALSALRGHAWRVLLQSDVENALVAARAATNDAFSLARWCLDDRRGADGTSRAVIDDQLVRALDAGRALVLHAATATGRVHDELTARGDHHLAKVWTDTSLAPPVGAIGAVNADELAPLLLPKLDLRNQVVHRLTDRDGPASGAALLDPLPVNEIGATLAGAGHDAMVFLVGGAGARPYAVVVDNCGEVAVLDLPGLSKTGVIDEYIQTLAGSADGRGPAFEAWRKALRRLCDWAWAAAMGPVLAHVGRPTPRLVLVPFGVLGLVPWHAARRAVGGEVRYALQDAVLSVAASARLWCEAAKRPPSSAGRALVLGDPGGNLPSAAEEAAAIHATFYPDGVHLGNTAGTVAELSAWLTERDAEPCPVLHIAGHAWVDAAEPANSHLQLADGTLRVGELIERLRHGGRALATVVLAACTTSVSGTTYDEALSLSSAFLVAGARSVVGSLWSVPSASTGLLMFMLHRYLADRPDHPADALREAQLWMLDPARRVPSDLPAALCDAVALSRLDEEFRWAGFSHLGR